MAQTKVNIRSSMCWISKCITRTESNGTSLCKAIRSGFSSASAIFNGTAPS